MRRMALLSLLLFLALAGPAAAQCTIYGLGNASWNEVRDGMGCEVKAGRLVTVRAWFQVQSNHQYTATPPFSIGTFSPISDFIDKESAQGMCQYTLRQDVGTIYPQPIPCCGLPWGITSETDEFFFTYIAQVDGEIPHGFGYGLPTWNCRDHFENETIQTHPTSSGDEFDYSGPYIVQMEAVVSGPVCIIR